LGSCSTLSDSGRYLTSLLYFLDHLIEAGFAQRQHQLVDALGVLFGTKLFVETSEDNELLSAFNLVNWETVDANFFDKELQKSPFEIVGGFLTRVIENVSEVFQRLQPMINSLAEATKLSHTGNFVIKP
jgi:hypothetical protein